MCAAKNTNDIASSLNTKPPDGLDRQGKPYRVLVVDDSKVMRIMIVQFLRSESYEIAAEAENGSQAVTLYTEHKPDIVTMDVNMPVMDGMQALQKIMEIDNTAKIVMLTSEGQKENIVTAIKMGAKNYIVKPPERRMVLEKIKYAIDN